MTKSEFLKKLRAALGNDLSGAIIEENVNYYKNYIEEEESHGRSEEDILEELGDPWVLAQTIIDSAAIQGQKAGVYEEASGYQSERGTYAGSQKESGSIYRRVLFILGVLGVLLVIFTVIGGIISFVAPIVVPLIVIVLIINLFKRKR